MVNSKFLIISGATIRVIFQNSVTYYVIHNTQVIVTHQMMIKMIMNAQQEQHLLSV